jgi:hypothetical protein
VSHLVKRFWWAVTAPALSEPDETWVRSALTPAEWDLFATMSASDQEHHLRVARRFVSYVEHGEVPRPWVAAALLHDSGKLVCGLGTFGRVGATLWPFGRRGDGRLGRYHRHEAIGATLLRNVGSDPETVALVGGWPSAPRQAGAALYRADDL